MLPLADVRVIALEQFGAGPWGTLQLADMGAEVIKIEDPVSRGDVGRYVPPFAEGEDSLFFEAFNRNKKSISLDLRRPEARGVLEDLVRVSDVVYSNLRGDQPARLGITYDALKDVNPRIVCCSLSGFGMTGPRAARGRLRLHDAGARRVDGAHRRSRRAADEERALPRRSLRGLRLRARRARRPLASAPRRCRLRLRRLAVRDRPARALLRRRLGGDATGTCRRGGRNSAHPSIVPFQNFATADGWIVVACPKQKFWEALCGALGRPELAADERFADFAARDRNRDELLAILDAEFAARGSAEWLELLAGAGVPSAPGERGSRPRSTIRRPRRAGRSSRSSIRASARSASPRARCGSATSPPLERAPFRGEHTAAVLRELCGYAPERLAELAAAGVFGEGYSITEATSAETSSPKSRATR